MTYQKRNSKQKDLKSIKTSDRKLTTIDPQLCGAENSRRSRNQQIRPHLCAFAGEIVILSRNKAKLKGKREKDVYSIENKIKHIEWTDKE